MRAARLAAAVITFAVTATAIRAAERPVVVVMIGVRPDGTKELIAIEDGYRESTESWAAVLRSLKPHSRLSAAGSQSTRRTAELTRYLQVRTL